MSLRNIWIVFLKELKDITRDRRTLMFMIILPLAAAPLLMIVMGKLLAFGVKQVKESPGRVAVIGAENSPRTMAILEAMESLDRFATTAPVELALGLAESMKEQQDPLMGLLVAAGIDSAAEVKSLLKLTPAPGDREATRKAIEEKELEVAIVIPENFDADVAAERRTALTLHYDSSFDKSREAQKRIATFVRAYARGVVQTRLPKHGLSADFLQPFDVKADSVASKEKEGRALLAQFLPYLLILMCLSGAVYPATDLGAGEKERGTLETLLVSPAERTDLVMGKFFVIFLTSLVAAALNIFSIGFSLGSGLFAELGKEMPFTIDPLGFTLAIALMLPVAAIFAAVLLSISIFAKSFKEAQAYFVPFNFVVIIPAFFSFIPGVELNVFFSLIPLVNVSLAIKEVLAGTYKWGCLALILASTVVIAGACIAFCAAWFKREEVLFRT